MAENPPPRIRMRCRASLPVQSMNLPLPAADKNPSARQAPRFGCRGAVLRYRRRSSNSKSNCLPRLVEGERVGARNLPPSAAIKQDGLSFELSKGQKVDTSAHVMQCMEIIGGNRAERRT